MLPDLAEPVCAYLYDTAVLRARAAGAALLVASRTDTDGRVVRTAAALNVGAAPQPGALADDDAAEAGEPFVIRPDVYPGTLTLVPGGLPRVPEPLDLLGLKLVERHPGVLGEQSGTHEVHPLFAGPFGGAAGTRAPPDAVTQAGGVRFEAQ